jgi:hypothetical protein
MGAPQCRTQPEQSSSHNDQKPIRAVINLKRSTANKNKSRPMYAISQPKVQRRKNSARTRPIAENTIALAQELAVQRNTVQRTGARAAQRQKHKRFAPENAHGTASARATRCRATTARSSKSLHAPRKTRPHSRWAQSLTREESKTPIGMLSRPQHRTAWSSSTDPRR